MYILKSKKADVSGNLFYFEYSKHFISQTITPIEDLFSPINWSRRDLQN
jgi:hypothetical protein